jgi:hypothetical protein
MHQRVRDQVVLRALPPPTESHWRRAALAAAILIALAVPSVYQLLREKQRDVDDERLLDNVAANLSRGLPEALAPLQQPVVREGAR